MPGIKCGKHTSRATSSNLTFILEKARFVVGLRRCFFKGMTNSMKAYLVTFNLKDK